jgi:hypothetical protein
VKCALLDVEGAQAQRLPNQAVLKNLEPQDLVPVFDRNASAVDSESYRAIFVYIARSSRQQTAS